MANRNTEVGEEEGICFCDGQLSCIGQDWQSIPEHVITSYCTLATRLDLSFNTIRSLKAIERFENLQELILDNNNIPDMTDLPALPHLHTLMLNKNHLKNLERLLDRLEKSCPHLTYLSLLGNEACPNQLSSLDKDEEDYQRYRYYVLFRLPNLKFLDSAPVSDSERREAKKRGPFLKVVRPQEDPLKVTVEEKGISPYSPLPQETRELDDAKATFGKCKYVYYGRHSEGNRFIRNSDL